MCVLKRLGFSLEIHIFFSSKKNVNLKRKTQAFQNAHYIIDF